MIERIVIRAGLTAVIGPNIVGQRAGGRRLGVARPRGDRPEQTLDIARLF